MFCPRKQPEVQSDRQIFLKSEPRFRFHGKQAAADFAATAIGLNDRSFQPLLCSPISVAGGIAPQRRRILAIGTRIPDKATLQPEKCY